MMTREEIEAALPAICEWVEQQENMILKAGIPLNESQLVDARQIGVTQPERVRLFPYEHIPIATLPPKITSLVKPDTEGLTARYGVFIRPDLMGKRLLIAHELVHTKQYEQLGIVGFLRPYLIECYLPPGYPNGPMEQEAIRTSEKLCAG